MRSKIFSTDQVRAIQDGRMTQFMQVVKHHLDDRGARYCGPQGWEDWHGTPIKCPFGKVGDVIAVRETWWSGYELNDNDHVPESAPLVYTYFADSRHNRPADMSDSKCAFLFGNCKADWPAWRSPATMPREAARLFLRITREPRVMRVQELTEADMIAQGIVNRGILGYSAYGIDQSETAQEAFIYKEGKTKWNENKFHWIIDFTKIDKP